MKYKLLVATSAALLLSGSARAQVDAGAIDPALREATEDISAYDALSALPTLGQRKTVFRSFNASRKAAAWRVHMKRYLARNPDLSEEQKAAIKKAIAVFTPELYTITSDDPRWSTQVDAPLEKMREEFLQVFSPGAVRELLLELGERDTLKPSRIEGRSVADPEQKRNGLASRSPVAHPGFESSAFKFRDQHVAAWPGMASHQQLLTQVRVASSSRLSIRPLLPFFTPDCSCSTSSDWCG
jgi:hypothetical protein